MRVSGFALFVKSAVLFVKSAVLVRKVGSFILPVSLGSSAVYVVRVVLLGRRRRSR